MNRNTYDNAVSMVHKKFADLAGVDHIATISNMQALYDICIEIKPKRVLEIGAGGGTMTTLLMNITDAHVDAYEDIDYVIEYFKENMKRYEKQHIDICVAVKPIASSIH